MAPRVVAALLGLAGCTKAVAGISNDSPLTAASISAVVGDSQTAAPSQAVPTSPAVRVTDHRGNAVPGITVVFAAGSGGSVVDGVGHTDANGVAAAGKWILGPNPGVQTLTASVPGLATVTFVATAVVPTTPIRVSIGLRPYGLAISPSGIVYVSQLDGSSVTRVQFGASTTSGLVGVGFTPTDVTFDPSGATAFVTNQFDPSVGVIDVAGARQVQTVAAASTTFRVLVSSDGQRTYATESGGRLLVINTSTRALVATVPIPTAANGLAFGVGDSLLYVTSMSGGLAIVNVKTNSVVRSSTLGGTLQDVVVSPDGGTLYVAHEETGVIDVVNATSSVVTAHFTVGAGVFGLKLSPDGRSLWATQPSAGQVIVVDRATGSISRTLSVGGIPRRIAFDRTTGRAAVSNEAGWVDFLP